MTKMTRTILSVFLWICIVMIVASDSREPAKFNSTNNVEDFNSINHVNNYNNHIYYVDGINGNNKNPGTTQELAWKTIQKAADTLIAGNIVIIKAGNYAAERVQLTQSGNSGAMITYLADGAVTTKGFIIQANYITIRGFEIANTDYRRWDREKSSGIFIRGSNNVIENNIIHDASLNGIFIYSAPSEPTASSNNIIRNNQLFHNELAGIEVNGHNNLIEGNEVWGTVQCHPTLMAVEDIASDNNGQKCPDYPAVSGLDADGMRFFGGGHIIRKNYIHDIVFGPDGINPSIGDYNDAPHIDCFQTFGPYSNFVEATNITIEQNRCAELYVHGDGTAHGSGVTLGGQPNNITIKNNIFFAYGGVATYNTTVNSHHIYVLNNTFINDLSFNIYHPLGVGLENSPYSVIKNNIFYNHNYHTVYILTDTGTAQVDYNLAYNNDGTIPPCVAWGNWNTCQPTSNHELWNVNPQFVDPASGDYHLHATSPAIDAGYNLGNLVINDFEGIIRPQGAGYDIGAYELTAP
jgi:parallel beta-helix repeat protein